GGPVEERGAAVGAGEEPGDLDDDLRDGADADGQEERGPEGTEREPADPDPGDGRPAGQERQQREVGQARAFAQDRRGDADALGDVVERETGDQEDPERYLAQREGRADGQPLAEVVQPDAERDAVGDIQPAP